MSSDEVEWIGVDYEFGKPSTRIPRPFPPNRPRPTNPPRRIPRPTVPLPPRLPPRIPIPDEGSGDPHDAPDKMPPAAAGASPTLSSATVISVSLVSCLVVMVLVLALFYFLVFRKRLKKISSPTTPAVKRDDYSIRIEDVAHLSLEENDAVYMNTTDLQRLVSTMRSKSKKPLPPPPGHSNPYNTNNFPDVVQVTSPDIPAPTYSHPPAKPPHAKNHSIAKPSLKKPTTLPPNAPIVKSHSREDLSNNVTISRPAPPPPQNTINRQEPKKIEKPPPPKVSSKPIQNPKPAIEIQKPSLPLAKPSIVVPNSAKRPILPPLKMTQLKKEANQLDSCGIPTPDTASSFLMETFDGESEPERMSVKAKRAFLESAMASEKRT